MADNFLKDYIGSDPEFHADTQALMLRLGAKHAAREAVVAAARKIAKSGAFHKKDIRNGSFSDWVGVNADYVRALQVALVALDALDAGGEPERDWQEGMGHG